MSSCCKLCFARLNGACTAKLFLKKEWQNMREKLLIFIAWHLPRSLVAWCAIRLGAHATQGQYSSQVVPELTFMDALKRWDA